MAPTNNIYKQSSITR